MPDELDGLSANWLASGPPSLGDGDSQNANWMRRYRALHPVCSLREHDPAFGPVFQRGKGSYLWDVGGHRWVDLTCGYSASNFGHAYEPLIRAACEQLAVLTHLTAEPHVPGIELAEDLVRLLSTEDDRFKVVYNTTGARAIESSLKAAYSFRPGKVLCLSPGFHGRSIATAAISDTPRVPLSNALDSLVVRWPKDDYPYCLRCPLGLAYPACSVKCVDRLLAFIQVNHRQISCLLVEPALGARGYVFPPDEFLQRLCTQCKHHGIVVIADEIQTGLGRCGDWLLSRQQGWEPDLIVLGKSLGGGLTPLAAVVGRQDVLECIRQGAESETFAGNPLACSIGRAVLGLLARESLMDQGRAVGRQLRQAIRSACTGRSVCDSWQLEGRAASCVVDFAGSAPSAGLEAEQARLFANACLRHRLRVHLTGPVNTRVVMLPALTMTSDELSETCRLLVEAVDDCAKVLEGNDSCRVDAQE